MTAAMHTAEKVLEVLRRSGAILFTDGEELVYDLPHSAQWLKPRVHQLSYELSVLLAREEVTDLERLYNLPSQRAPGISEGSKTPTVCRKSPM